jgi:hypothetical protein
MDHSIDIRFAECGVEDPAIQEALSEHRQRNAELQKVLVAKNIDLKERRPIDVHFWAWSQRDAAVIGRDLFKRGFLVKLIAPSPQPGDEERWGVEAGALIVPEEILGDEFTEGMVRLASTQDGTYDGWGTDLG